MIKFSGTVKASGRPVLGIGLSRENCEHLLQGESIEVSTEGLDVFLMGGETDIEMAALMAEHGVEFPDGIRPAGSEVS